MALLLDRVWLATRSPPARRTVARMYTATASSQHSSSNVVRGFTHRRLLLGLLAMAIVAAVVSGASLGVGAPEADPEFPPAEVRSTAPEASVLPPTSARLPTPELDRAAVAALYGQCMRDNESRAHDVVVGRGSGRTIAVVGDSITSQTRERLAADPDHRWVIWSRCGATTESAGAAGAMAAVLGYRPDVLVVALGTNDTGFPDPSRGASAGFGVRGMHLLAHAAAVPCVVWVEVAQVGDAVLQGEMDTVNATVAAFPRIRVAPWAAVVGAMHSLLTDRVHLSTAGVAARIGLMARAADSC